MRLKTAVPLLFAALAAGGLYNYTSALMVGGAHRLFISEQTTVGNSMPKIGGAYSLLGSTTQLGYGALAGGRYTVTSGVVNSWRPPQADLNTAHVYPNPCMSSRGCTGVTFTRLTQRATINIFTLSGEKVVAVEKNSNIDSVGWDLRNSAGAKVASGLYFFVVKGEGSVKKGKIVIVR